MTTSSRPAGGALAGSLDHIMPIYLTKEALGKLRSDLHHARTVGRNNASRAIAEARAHGDLKENAEYDAAKDTQGRLEARIAKMEYTLGEARVVDESQVDTSRARILSTVRVLNKSVRREQSFKLVSVQEANISKGLISIASPIGKGLLGSAVGDTIRIEVPRGVVELEVLAISRDG